MSIRRICIYCDKYFTPLTADINETGCPHCCKELGIVKSDLAERTLKELKSKFPS